MSENEDTKPTSKRGRVSQTDVPRHPLGEALRVPRVLEDHYGGGGTTPLNVCTSLGSTPQSSWFRTITGAAVAYGLTDGAYNSTEIKLTALGSRAVAPTEEGDDLVALRESALRPTIMRQFLQKYDQKKIPPENIAQNVLASLGVEKEAAERTLKVILQTAEDAGILRELKGERYVDLKGSTPPRPEDRSADAALDDGPVPAAQLVQSDEAGGGASQPLREQPSQPKPIFIGHGKKKASLHKLENILRGFKVPFVVATAEPNLGRPIPTKVKNVMKQCGSAILVFTRDERFFDENGTEIWRPSENVVYELGAASYEYDDRVVILMEKGLEFPANFESIGRIEFEEDSLEAKTMELVQELIGLGLLRLTTAA